jgi:hypothetical protein
MVVEVAEEGEFAKSPLGERDLVEYTVDHLDCHRLSRYIVCGRAAENGKAGGGTRFRTQSRITVIVGGAHITTPYAPEPISRISFQRFSTRNVWSKHRKEW